MIRKFLANFALVSAALLPASSFAQASSDHGKTDMPKTATLTDGEVRKVDQEAGKITIRHGDIKHLDMPGMTMVFTAKDKGMLAAVKAGDKVKFMAIHEGGKMVVTDIQPAR